MISALLAFMAVMAGRAAWLGASGARVRPLDASGQQAPTAVPRSLAACCAAADLPIDPVRVWRWYRLVVVGGPTVVLIGTGLPIAAVSVVGLLAAPRLALPSLQRRQAVRRDVQLAPFLERVASSIRSGRSVRSALVEVARRTERPLGAELAPLADALDHGASLEAAVEHWSSGPSAGAEVRLAAAALRMGARAGGEVARAVDGLAATLRERRELRGEVVALATQASTSAGLLVVAPIGFAALVSTIEPGTVRFLLGTPAGLVCLTVGLALDAAGAFWMQRIVGRTT